MLKNDKLDALILLSGSVLIDENVRHFESTDTSCVLRPRSLDRRVKRNIKRESLKNDFGTFFKYAKRVAAVILVICTVSFAAIISVDAVRKAVWNIVVEFFDDYLSISFAEDGKDPSNEDENNEAATIEKGWKRDIIFYNGDTFLAEYFNDGTIMFTYEISHIADASDPFGSENTEVESLKILDCEGMLFVTPEDEFYGLSWIDEGYLHTLLAFSESVTKDQLILWAQSADALSYTTEMPSPKAFESVREIDIGENDWEKKVLIDSVGMHSVMYYENGKKVLHFTQGDSSHKIMIDNENSTVEEISIGNNKAVLVYRVDHKLYSLVWNDSAYSYSLNAYSPDISKEALISMAESLK